MPFCRLSDVFLSPFASSDVAGLHVETLLLAAGGLVLPGSSVHALVTPNFATAQSAPQFTARGKASNGRARTASAATVGSLSRKGFAAAGVSFTTVKHLRGLALFMPARRCRPKQVRQSFARKFDARAVGVVPQ